MHAAYARLAAHTQVVTNLLAAIPPEERRLFATRDEQINLLAQ